MFITFIISFKYEIENTEHICMRDIGITVGLYMACSTVSQHYMI